MVIREDARRHLNLVLSSSQQIRDMREHNEEEVAAVLFQNQGDLGAVADFLEGEDRRAVHFALVNPAEVPASPISDNGDLVSYAKTCTHQRTPGQVPDSGFFLSAFQSSYIQAVTSFGEQGSTPNYVDPVDQRYHAPDEEARGWMEDSRTELLVLSARDEGNISPGGPGTRMTTRSAKPTSKAASAKLSLAPPAPTREDEEEINGVISPSGPQSPPSSPVLAEKPVSPTDSESDRSESSSAHRKIASLISSSADTSASTIVLKTSSRPPFVGPLVPVTNGMSLMLRYYHRASPEIQLSLLTKLIRLLRANDDRMAKGLCPFSVEFFEDFAARTLQKLVFEAAVELHDELQTPPDLSQEHLIQLSDRELEDYRDDIQSVIACNKFLTRTIQDFIQQVVNLFRLLAHIAYQLPG